MGEPKEVTLGDLVEFVLNNRKGNAFKGHTEYQIAHGIELACDEGVMHYACREDNSVCGIVCGYLLPEHNIFHVQNILVTEPWAYVEFLKILEEKYKTFRLRAFRRGKIRFYNTEQFIRKALHHG